jgi:hypothetical protein
MISNRAIQQTGSNSPALPVGIFPIRDRRTGPRPTIMISPIEFENR